MTTNLRALLGAALIFYLVAAVNDAAAMYVLSAAAVAVLLVCFFLTRLTIRGVSFELSLPAVRGRPGRPMAAALVVRNAGAIRRAGLSFEAVLQNHTVPPASFPLRYPFPALEPHSVTEWQVQWLPSHRGHYTFSRTRLVASDPLGLYHRGTRPRNAPGFWVLPETVDLHEAMPAEMLTALIPSTVGLSQRGGAEFLGVRPHQPGDDLRQVHWKLTAHTGELLVREYRLLPELAITIWLDLAGASYPEMAQGRDERVELAICAAASLIQTVARHGLAFSLAGPGLPEVLALTSRGEAAAQRCLMALAEARITHQQTFPHWCAHTTPLRADIAALLVVSPALPDAAVHLTPLLQRGVRLIGLCPLENPQAFPDQLQIHAGPLVLRRKPQPSPAHPGNEPSVLQAAPAQMPEPSLTVGCASFHSLAALPLAVARALEEHTAWMSQ